MSKITMQHNRRIPIINAKSIGFTIAFAIVGAMLLITGCGGGGGPNYPTPTLPTGAVVFDSSNATDIANQSVSSSGFVGSSAKQTQITSTVNSVMGLVATQFIDSNQSAAIATGATQTIVYPCLGDGDPSTDDGDITVTASGNNSSVSGTLSFNNCIEGSLKISGSISFGGSANNAGDFNFEGGGSITITDLSDSTYIKMVMYFNESGNLVNSPYPFTSSFSFSLEGTGLPNGGILVATTQPFVGDINGVSDGEITIYGGGGTTIRIDITGIGTADVYLDEGVGEFLHESITF